MTQEPYEMTASNLWTDAEMGELIVYARLHLYNRGLACGPNSIRAYLMSEYAFDHLPSGRKISDILYRDGLTKGRTGTYGEE